jgi:hypothetical protein
MGEIQAGSSLPLVQSDYMGSMNSNSLIFIYAVNSYLILNLLGDPIDPLRKTVRHCFNDGDNVS